MNESFESEDEYTPEEEVMNKLSLGTENAIDQDFVDALEEKRRLSIFKRDVCSFFDFENRVYTTVITSRSF